MYVSTFPIGIVTGLPSIIPGPLRLLLKKRDPVAIRGCLAFLALFRILKVPSILKLETITKPFSGLYPSVPSLEIGKVFKTLHHPQFKLKRPLDFVRANTAGPNGAPSVLNI